MTTPKPCAHRREHKWCQGSIPGVASIDLEVRAEKFDIGRDYLFVDLGSNVQQAKVTTRNFEFMFWCIDERETVTGNGGFRRRDLIVCCYYE